MAASTWLLGSRTIPASVITVGATACNLAAGPYYLHSGTAALSMIASLATAIVAGVGGTCTIQFQRDRKLRITFNTSRAITWTSTDLRDLLGFEGAGSSSATTHTATLVSPLLWSPGYLATPATIYEVDGYTVNHQSVFKSDDGSQIYCDHYGDETHQELSWTHIVPARMRVDDGDDQGGTFHTFYQEVLRYRRRILWVASVDESDASTDVATVSSFRGPYAMREDFSGNWYRRNVPYAEVSSPLELPLMMPAEYA